MTERNLQPDAESLRHVQGTTLGIKLHSPEYQAGDQEALPLRSSRKVLRGAVTRLLKAATQIRQAPSPYPSDLLGAINVLILKDGVLNELNETIGEMLKGDEFELDYSDAFISGKDMPWCQSAAINPERSEGAWHETAQHFRRVTLGNSIL